MTYLKSSNRHLQIQYDEHEKNIKWIITNLKSRGVVFYTNFQLTMLVQHFN